MAHDGTTEFDRDSVQGTDYAGLVRMMLDDEGIGMPAASGRMGMSHSYVGQTMSQMRRLGTVPSCDVMARLAEACGYELRLVGHGRNVRIRPRERRDED